MLYNTENPHGGDVYGGSVMLDFSANTNPFGMPEGVKAAIRASLDSLDRYPDPYCRRLVRAIAEHDGVKAEQVLVGAGAAELIYSFAHAQRPQIALELAPTFSEYTLPLENSRIVRLTLKEENGFAVTKELLELIESSLPDTVFLCSPNNPTGSVIDAELLKKTAGLCREKGIRLLLDECFLELSDAGESLVSLVDSHPNLIILKAFTKNYGMAGVRLGYVLCSDAALLERMARTVQPWNVSTVAQSAGLAALSESTFLEKTLEHIKKERRKLKEGIERLGFKVFDSNANFLLFKGWQDLESALIKKGIKIRNCSNFHGLNECFYRIAVKLDYENEMLLCALRIIAEEKKNG